MGVGMLRRYHTQAPEHVNEPGDVEASKEAQAVTETGGTVEGDNGAAAAPAGNASQADWADWVLTTRPDLDEATVRAMKRDELREQYGPKAE